MRGVQKSLLKLEKLLLPKPSENEQKHFVQPLFALWLKNPHTFHPAGRSLPAGLASKHLSKLFPEIRNACLAAVKKAMKTLHYEASPPDVSFLCPKQSSVCSRVPHPATVVESINIIKCLLEPRVSHPLTAELKTWLPKSAGMTYSFFSSLFCLINIIHGLTL